jgi:hypothetical protein
MTLAFKVLRKQDVGNGRISIDLQGGQGVPNITVQDDVGNDSKWPIGASVTLTLQVA